MLVLDARGCITFCNTPAADLFGRAKDDVIGKQVTTLIPELPFGRYTPEFNLAFVFFHGDDGLWTRRSLRTSDGGQLAIDVSIGSATGGPLSSVSEIDKRSIVLVIKDASVPAGMARRAYIPVNRAIQARDTVGTEIRSN
jgi:PAS domain S-box-containing protein